MNPSDSSSRPSRTLVYAATATAFAALSYVMNPGYFADAPMYAMDVLGPLIPRTDHGIDSGHLIWRPVLDCLLAFSRLMGWRWDALIILRTLSALATGFLAAFTLLLASKLGFSTRQQFLAVVLLGGSASVLVVGGSGAPYSAMALFILLAVVLVTPPPEWRWRRALTGALSMGTACTFWGVGLMLMPVFTLAAFLGRGGTIRQRLAAAIGLSALATGAAASCTVVAWWAWGGPQTGLGFVDWMSVASHGAAAAPSGIGAARAILGAVRALVDLGDLGYVIKSVMLGQTAGSPGRQLLFAAIIAAAVGVMAVLAAIGTGRLLRSGSRLAQAGALGLAAWLPNFLFTVSYGGNELHMTFGAIPFVALAFVAGLDAVSPRVTVAFTCLLWATNLTLGYTPSALAARHQRQSFGTVARNQLPPFSTLVVTGQDFAYLDALPMLYRDSIRVVNIRTEVLTHGPETWAERLDSCVALSYRLGGRVAVLSDLIGEPTPQGLKLLPQEQPTPSLEEVNSYFAGWQRGQRWSVGRFTFVELTARDEKEKAPTP